MDIRNVAVFCGSNMGDNPVFQERIIMLADSLIQEGWGLVYGGGHRGLMGEISQYMLEHGPHTRPSAIDNPPPFLNQTICEHDYSQIV